MAEPTGRSTDVDDYNLQKTPQTPGSPPPQSPPMMPWVFATVAALASITAYLVLTRQHAEPPTAPAVKTFGETAQSIPPLGGIASPITVPPLDESDALVRQLVQQISSHPTVGAWLMSDKLIRNFAVVVSNVAEGMTPAVHLRTLRPTSRFSVIDRGGRLTLDPQSYARYDGIAAAAASIDPAGAARLYATLKPRIEEASRDLGSTTPFDRTLELAIVSLLKVPAPPDPISVRPEGGTGYAFADPTLENLTPAQKHLLRTGSANVRKIQSSLRAIALAMGIPPDRLPPPKT